MDLRPFLPYLFIPMACFIRHVDQHLKPQCADRQYQSVTCLNIVQGTRKFVPQTFMFTPAYLAIINRYGILSSYNSCNMYLN